MHASLATAPLDVEAVWAALAEIPDPEIPTISIVDLGIVRSVQADDDRLLIELLPTFVGCPALDAIRVAVEDRLAGARATVEVAFSFAEPWTTDRITDRGRLGLLAGGFAPPMPAAAGPGRLPGGGGDPLSIVPLDVAIPCPTCGSRRTRLDNAFGPTLCRSIRYCLDCRQPFEGFKVV
jgi:ring-1,2-phenylacetyl-CoA epoxidase subunit PaaD